MVLFLELLFASISLGLEQPLWISVKQRQQSSTLWFPFASTHVPSPPSSSPTLAFSLWSLAIASWVPSFLKSWRRSEYAIISPFSLIFTFMSPAFNHACIFVWQHNEIMTKRAMKDKRLAMTDTLWDITRSPYSNNVKTEMWVLFYLVANSKQAWGHHHWSPVRQLRQRVAILLPSECHWRRCWLWYASLDCDDICHLKTTLCNRISTSK